MLFLKKVGAAIAQKPSTTSTALQLYSSTTLQLYSQARSWLSISGGALQKECNRGAGMILTFVLAASFPFQLRKIGIERNVLLYCKSIILVLNFVRISLSYFSIELTLYLDRLI
jgi:hypothetical protein